MGDFKTAFIEGLGKSLAYGVGALIFLIVFGLLVGAGVLPDFKLLKEEADTVAALV